MRRTIVVLAAGSVFALLAFLVWQRGSPPGARPEESAREYATPRPLPPPPAPERAVAEAQPQLAPPLADQVVVPGKDPARRPPLLDALGAATTKPEAEPQIVHRVLEAYRRALGGFPAGEGNRQILNALRGANVKRLPFVPGDHPRLNARGELTDGWGTPFFFHALSRDWMEVRSAGADRELFTADDLVAGSPPPRPAKPTIPTSPPASK